MEKLYIKFKTTGLDAEHEFAKTYSGIYDCTEYVWHGYLKKNWKFSFCDENGTPIPYAESYNQNGGPGFTTDTELTNTEFTVRNALVQTDGQFVYSYSNEDSFLAYNGTWRKVYLYVRIYEDENNCRWLAVNLQHDKEDDLNRLRTIGLIDENTTEEEAEKILAEKMK